MCQNTECQMVLIIKGNTWPMATSLLAVVSAYHACEGIQHIAEACQGCRLTSQKWLLAVVKCNKVKAHIVQF